MLWFVRTKLTASFSNLSVGKKKNTRPQRLRILFIFSQSVSKALTVYTAEVLYARNMGAGTSVNAQLSASGGTRDRRFVSSVMF